MLNRKHFQTFRSKTTRIRVTDQRKKYDSFVVYKICFKHDNEKKRQRAE